jgi:hypothetical protein
MKRLPLPLPLSLLLLGALVAAYRATRAPSAIATTQEAALAPAKRTGRGRRDGGHGTARGEVTIEGAVPPSPTAILEWSTGHSSEAVRERIRHGEHGTYIGEILLARDSAIARWPDRRDEPLRVWVAEEAAIDGWNPAFPQRVRDAFTTWEAVGIPMRFTFVVDSTDADVHVSWIDHFDAPISGKTLWSRDRHWWIVGGNITLALHHNGGEALDSSAVYAIALHEVGHLLGLDHTMDASNIMTPKVRVRELSDADRATVRLLYTLPAGPIR